MKLRSVKRKDKMILITLVDADFNEHYLIRRVTPRYLQNVYMTRDRVEAELAFLVCGGEL